MNRFSGLVRFAPHHDAPTEVTFGFGSCHQPFGPPSDGVLTVTPRVGIYRQMVGVLRARGARFLSLIGDQIYSDGVLYFAEETPEAEAYEAAAGIRGKAVGRDGLYEHCEHAPKMLVIFRDASRTDGAVEQLQRAFAGRITAVKSDPNYIEIIRPGVNKASALHQLAELLQISPEETMAIGDSNNDLPMLKAAGHSVAMGNAGEHVQKITDYVTDTCDADGVAVAIRRYVLGTEG